MRNPEQERLIEQFNAGDERAFDRIFELFKKDVKTVAYFILRNQEDAEDVVQDLFLKLWLKRGTLNVTEDLRTYINTAARNLSIDKFNANSKDASRKQKYAVDGDVASSEQISFDKDSGIMVLVKEALKRVPPKSRAAFEMIYFSQMSYKEAAEKARVSQTTVKTNARNALNYIRRKLGGKGKGPANFFLILFICFLLQSSL